MCCILDNPTKNDKTHYLQNPPQCTHQMLKFTAGAILGWTAARTLDNKPFMLPTLEELLLLTAKGKALYENTLKQIQDNDDPPPNGRNH